MTTPERISLPCAGHRCIAALAAYSCSNVLLVFSLSMGFKKIRRLDDFAPRAWLVLRCEVCEREVACRVADVIGYFREKHWTIDVERVPRRFRCQTCGQRRLLVKVAWNMERMPGFRPLPPPMWELPVVCNLYRMTSNVQAIRDIVTALTGPMPNVPVLTEIYPGQSAPVVRRCHDGSRELAMLRWGFPLEQAGKAPKSVTNARSDNLGSPFWRDSFRQRRCLVPVTEFCEWTQDHPKQQVWFAMRDTPVFAFAGLWRHWRGRVQGQEATWTVFAFLTCSANAVVADVHPKAMPVMLGPDQFDTWLDGTPEQAQALARPLAAERTMVTRDGRLAGLPPQHGSANLLL